jgi:hypothetical protein
MNYHAFIANVIHGRVDLDDFIAVPFYLKFDLTMDE